MKKLLLCLAAIFVIGCAGQQPIRRPVVVNLKLESDIPVSLTIAPKKDCTNNWNFCQYQ